MKAGPILPDNVVQKVNEDMYGNIEAKGPEMPGWVKSAAKLLNGGSDGQDWTALAGKLGKYHGVGDRVGVKYSTCTWYLYLSTYLSVLDVLEYLVYRNVKVLVLVLVLDQKVLGT